MAPAPGDPPRTLHCTRGHTFDLAKQGYVSLLTGASTKMTGDTPAMLDARAAFQSAGHFTPIATALAAAVAAAIPTAGTAPHSAATVAPTTSDPDSATGLTTAVFGAESPSAATAPEHRPTTARVSGITAPGSSVAAASAAWLTATLLSVNPPSDRALGSGHRRPAQPTPEVHPTAGPAVLEIGAGTGYYLGAVLDAVPRARGIALDVSKAAARRAARAHARAGSVLADAWRGLPVPDGVMNAVVCVFAPRNADEVARVLAENGRFIVVTPTARHLGELIGPLGMVSVDADKQDRLADALGERFEHVSSEAVEYTMRLSREDMANVVAMGPSAFHAAEQRAEGLAALPDPMRVTAAVTVSVYRTR